MVWTCLGNWAAQNPGSSEPNLEVSPGCSPSLQEPESCNMEAVMGAVHSVADACSAAAELSQMHS